MLACPTSFTLYGEIENLTINGVDVGPLINAELDRRHPDRVKMRPTSPAGFREAVLALRRDRMSSVRQVIEGPDREVAGRPHRTGRRARLAGGAQLPGTRVPAHHPERGVGAPVVRGARPRRPGGAPA